MQISYVRLFCEHCSTPEEWRAHWLTSFSPEPLRRFSLRIRTSPIEIFADGKVKLARYPFKCPYAK